MNQNQFNIFHFFIFYLFAFSAFCQELKPSDIRVYTKSFKGFSCLDSTAEKSRVLLIGEKHRNEGNYPIFLKTFKYLHQNHDYNHVIIEYGESISWMINKYLDGDEEMYTILDQYLYTDDSFFIWLKSLKKYREKSTPFEVVGIDLELQEAAAVKALHLLCPDREPPTELKNELTKITSLLEKRVIDRSEYRPFIIEHVQFFYSNQLLFENYLNDNYTFYARIIKGLNEGLQYRAWRLSDINKAYHYREHFLYQNCKNYLATNQGKVIGQLGQIHVMKSDIRKFIQLENWKSLTTRLKENGVGVASVNYLYYKSINEFDREMLSSEFLDQVRSLKIKTNSLIKVSQFYQNSYFDWVIINNFDQSSKN